MLPLTPILPHTHPQLFSYIAERNTLNEADSRFFLSQVVLGFEHLHILGVVYRDLKVRRSRLAAPAPATHAPRLTPLRSTPATCSPRT